MGFDRNTIIGFALLAVLFIAYFFYVSSNQRAAMAEQKRIEDSLAALKPRIDPAAVKSDSLRLVRNADSVAAGGFAGAVNGQEQFFTLENDLIKATFTNKGGWLKQVTLKNYNGPGGQPAIMGGTAAEYFGYAILTQSGQSTETGKLYFSADTPKPVSGDSSGIAFVLSAADGRSINHKFWLKKGDYRVYSTIQLKGAAGLLSNQAINFNWQSSVNAQQKDARYERTQTRLVYKTDGEFDYNTATSGINKTLEQPTTWVGFKQQFFNSSLISGIPFKQVSADVVMPDDSVKSEVALLKTRMQMVLPAGNEVEIPMQLYYGPNDYKVLKSYDNDMHNIVDLGSGPFAFVKWINRWLILPVFDFLGKVMGSAGGWTILLLTIFIRLLIAPLTYSSYLSGAKMKALRPEIDALKAKFGEDQQAMSMEQMKLFREAGVNPLGGCIPALFQIPIFFALYSFFNSAISLRGVPFLWSKDLSSYDSILNFGFDIPFYGGHISLFTILACATSMLISLYSMASTPDTGNPMLKYMPYIFPVMMLFIFNRLPSALTWYYTVSNVITLALQFVIQNYIIDHNKILAQIKANKAKPKKRSKWQERLEAIQESQKKVEELKKKGNRRI